MKLIPSICAAIVTTFAVAGPSSAAIYDVDWTFGLQNVSGTIETDGRIGTHTFISTIENWASIDVTLTSPNLYGGGPAVVNDANLNQFVFYNLMITPTEILFDFEGNTAFVAGNRVATDISAPLGQTGFCMTGAVFPNLCGNGQLTRAASVFYEYDGIGNQITLLQSPFSGTQVLATARAATVPLPAAAPLLGTALAGLIAFRRRKHIG